MFESDRLPNNMMKVPEVYSLYYCQSSYREGERGGRGKGERRKGEEGGRGRGEEGGRGRGEKGRKREGGEEERRGGGGGGTYAVLSQCLSVFAVV